MALLIDKIAHRPFAGNTLILVVEDDPQYGADHVSAKRSNFYLVRETRPSSSRSCS